MYTADVSIIALYALAALLPAIFLLRYVYRLDTIEKEPPALLLKMIFGGILAAGCSYLLETLTTAKISQYASSTEMVILYALLVAVIEESTKFFFLKIFSWNHPAFNYRFDGIVYAVFVSLGFAAVENLIYIFSYGSIDVIVLRALLAIPAHMSFAVYMGIYYGRAKICEHAHDRAGAGWNLTAGFLLAVVFHAFYDGTLLMETNLSFIVFLLVVLFIYICIFRRIRHEAVTDESV